MDVRIQETREAIAIRRAKMDAAGKKRSGTPSDDLVIPARPVSSARVRELRTDESLGHLLGGASCPQ
jgi:hypothetical protein